MYDFYLSVGDTILLAKLRDLSSILFSDSHGFSWNLKKFEYFESNIVNTYPIPPHSPWGHQPWIEGGRGYRALCKRRI